MARIATRIQEIPFDATQEYQRFCQTAERTAQKSDGAVVVFTGLVRGGSGYPSNAILHLTIEHYPIMTEKLLTRVAEAIAAKFDLTRLTVIHRIGRVLVGEPIVIILASSQHRAAAFQATQEMITALKSEIPLWKKETTTTDSLWVSPQVGSPQEI